MDIESAPDTTSITIHSATSPLALTQLPDQDVARVALSPDDTRIALLKAGGVLRAYSLQLAD